MRIVPISAGEVIAPNCALIMPTAALVSTYASGSPSNSFVAPTSGGLRCRCFRGGVLSISAITGSYYVKYEEGASHKSLATSADGALRNCSYAAHHRRSSRGPECVGMVPGSPYPVTTFYGLGFIASASLSAMALAASRAASETTCPYLAVIWALLWPNSLPITGSPRLPFTPRDTKLWR